MFFNLFEVAFLYTLSCFEQTFPNNNKQFHFVERISYLDLSKRNYHCQAIWRYMIKLLLENRFLQKKEDGFN